MSEENEGQKKEQADGTPASAPATASPQTPPEGQGSWDKVQQAEYTRKTQRLSEIERRAGKFGWTPEAVFDWIEAQAAKQQQETTPASDPDETPANDDEPQYVKDLRNKVNASDERFGKVEFDNLIVKHFVTTGKDVPVTEDDITDLMLKQGMADVFFKAAERQTKMTGKPVNPVTLAARYIHNERIANEKKTGDADTTSALEDAAKDTNTVPGKTPAPKSEKTDNEKFADDIAPDEDGIEI